MQESVVAAPVFVRACVFSLVALVILQVLVPQSFSQSGTLIKPTLNISAYNALPIGIASYGLYNISSGTGPYEVSTNEVIGIARVNYLLAFNSSLTYSQNLSNYGASLQLNAIANITVRGKNYVYWLQNVVDFNTSNSTYYAVDNVWNMTTPNANMSNATVLGAGNITVSSTPLLNGTYQNQTFYGYGANTTSYEFPISLVPVILLGRNGGYPLVRMGFIDNGTYRFYDNITFVIPNGSASMIVTPRYMTDQADPSNSSYYDAEFVFGSEANGATTRYNQMNATLWLGYAAANGIRPFPALAVFALDTAEAATNLAVRQGNGYAIVKTGVPNYNTTIVLSGVPNSLQLPAKVPQFLTNTTITTTAAATTTVVQNSNGGGSQNPLFNFLNGLGLYRLLHLLGLE